MLLICIFIIYCTAVISKFFLRWTNKVFYLILSYLKDTATCTEQDERDFPDICFNNICF